MDGLEVGSLLQHFYRSAGASDPTNNSFLWRAGSRHACAVGPVDHGVKLYRLIIGIGLGCMFGARFMLGRAAGGEELQHPRPGAAEIVEDTRRHDAEVAVGNLAFGLADLRLADAGDDVQQLIVSLVHLIADLATLGNGHQHKLRLVANPEDFPEFVILAREIDDWQ